MAGSMNKVILIAVPTAKTQSKKFAVIPTIHSGNQTRTMSTGCRRTWK
jgi:hypothetical protein